MAVSTTSQRIASRVLRSRRQRPVMENPRLFSDTPYDCQLCGHGPLEEFAVPDSTVLWFCDECGLYQYGRLVENDAYAADYHSGYERHRKQKLRTATVRLNRIAAVLDIDTPRLLDIGCSVGCTLEASQRRGWTATGVDVNDDVVQDCRHRGFNSVLSDGLHLPFDDESFDVVTAWHVIEHVPDVKQTLAEWRRVLRPGGMLVMETPDATCLKVRLLGRRYKKFWPPEHIYTFTPHTLGQFVEQAGFQIVPPPVVGRLTDLSLGEAAHAVLYQSYHAARRVVGIDKAFQVFARRSAVASHKPHITAAVA